MRNSEHSLQDKREVHYIAHETTNMLGPVDGRKAEFITDGVASVTCLQTSFNIHHPYLCMTHSGTRWILISEVVHNNHHLVKEYITEKKLSRQMRRDEGSKYAPVHTSYELRVIQMVTISSCISDMHCLRLIFVASNLAVLQYSVKI